MAHVKWPAARRGRGAVGICADAGSRSLMMDSQLTGC